MSKRVYSTINYPLDKNAVFVKVIHEEWLKEKDNADDIMICFASAVRSHSNEREIPMHVWVSQYSISFDFDHFEQDDYGQIFAVYGFETH